MKKALSLFPFLWLAIVVNGQGGRAMDSGDLAKTITIVGKIVDRDSRIPLEYGTITVFSVEDSVVLTGGISDYNGNFSFEAPPRNFFLKIEFIAYHSKTIDPIEQVIGQALLDVGVIELVPNVNLLDEVEVRAERSTVMMSLDKRVFNVGKDLISAGGTAEDILRNVPGVSVDIDGNFTLRSNGGVRILLDGKSSLLVSGANSTGLRQIQADLIDYIEVITNPSARYDAEGLVGIINIVLKKNQAKGLNGSVNTNIGEPENFGVGLNLNYHKNKINWFMGIGGWKVNRPGTGSFRNQFYKLQNPTATLFSNMDRTHNRKSLSGYLKFGADYHLNPKNIFTASFSYRESKDNNSSKLIYKDAYGNANAIFLVTQRLEKEKEEDTNLNTFLTYRKLFSQKGHHLTADIRYEEKSVGEISAYEESYFDKNFSSLDTVQFNQLSNDEESNRLLGINLDYVLPINKAGKFEGGGQSAFRLIGNDYKVRDVVNNVEIPDLNFTNNFEYKEIIHSLYGNFGNKINDFSFQFGLRMEYSDVVTSLLQTDEVTTRQYTNFFPSTFLTYDLKNDNALQLSFSRRIQRPSFLDLNPFYTFRDRRNIFRGNPNIQPELTDSYELGHVKYLEIGSLSTIAYYRKTDNVIKRIQRVDENFPDRTITQAENLDVKKNFGLEFIYSISPKQWWNLNGDFNFFHSLSKGTYLYDGQAYYLEGQSFSMSAKTTSRFTFWKKINTQITLAYTAPRATTQGISKSMTALDFASSMDILKKNGTITLSVSDVFNSRRRRSFSEDVTFRSEDNFLWQARAIVLSFSYRFNQFRNSNQIYLYPKDIDEDEQY